MKRVPDWLWPLALPLVAMMLSTIPAAQRIEALMVTYEQPLLAVTIGLSAIGFVVMMGTVLSLVLKGPDAVNDEIARLRPQQDQAELTYIWRAAGREVEMETSFANLKKAWRSGDWWRDTRWRHLFLMIVGATFMFFGLFGIFVTIGPMPVRLLMVGVMTYAVARTAWGLARA